MKILSEKKTSEILEKYKKKILEDSKKEDLKELNLFITKIMKG